MLAQTIRDDIGLRKTSIANQQRAMERAATLRARVKRKGNGDDNALARVLDWHASSAKDSVRKNEDAVRAMERALEILELYSFAEDRAPPAPAEEEVSEALHDAFAPGRAGGDLQYASQGSNELIARGFERRNLRTANAFCSKTEDRP